MHGSMHGLNELGFKALRLFVAVLDHGSFSEVARREGVAPSSISRQIQLMEQALNQQLLYRHTRAVTPTEAGRLLGEHARLVLVQLEEAGQALQEQQSEPSGLVRINAPVVFGQRHLTPWLGPLCARYPKLQLDIQQTDSYVAPLQEGTDLLFRIGPLHDSSMQGRILAPQRFQVAASPAYLQRHGTPRHPDDLASHQCLAYKGVAGLQRVLPQRPTAMDALRGERADHRQPRRHPDPGRRAGPGAGDVSVMVDRRGGAQRHAGAGAGGLPGLQQP